jgi:hypothetical protein
MKKERWRIDKKVYRKSAKTQGFRGDLGRKKTASGKRTPQG